MRLIDSDKLCNDLMDRWSIADKEKDDLIRSLMADVVTPIVVSQPTVDAVPVAAYEQVRWERDIAVGQLEKLGYTLGEKVTPIVRCKDCKHHHYSVCEIPYCDRIDYGYGWKDEDFCSAGERKDGDHHEG